MGNVPTTDNYSLGKQLEDAKTPGEKIKVFNSGLETVSPIAWKCLFCGEIKDSLFFMKENHFKTCSYITANMISDLENARKLIDEKADKMNEDYEERESQILNKLGSLGFKKELSKLTFDPLYGDMKVNFTIEDVRNSKYLIEVTDNLLSNGMAYVSAEVACPHSFRVDDKILQQTSFKTYYSQFPVSSILDGVDKIGMERQSIVYISSMKVHYRTTEKGRKYLEKLLEKGIEEMQDEAQKRLDNERFDQWLNKAITARKI